MIWSDDEITKLGSSTWGRDRQSRERDPTNLLPLHFLLKADNYLNMPASFLPSRAFTSVIQQHVCEWKTSTALGTWGQQSWLPDTPAACWHSSRKNQVSGCEGSGGGRRRGRAEWRMQPQKPMVDQPRNQQADDVLCQMEVRGRLNQNNSNSSIMDKKPKRQPQCAYKENLDHVR